MSNQFLNSVVRGAGMSIGRNLVGDFGKIKKASAGRYYDRAENEIEKALNFPIQGRSETMLGKCFNLYQEFDAECTIKFDIGTELLLRKSKPRYYMQVKEKIKDCIEYLELKNGDDENIDKLKQLDDKVNGIFGVWIEKLAKSILKLTNSKDLEIARNAWNGYSAGETNTLKYFYNQAADTPKEVEEIEAYLQATRPVLQKVTNSSNPLPTLIGVCIGLYLAWWIVNTFMFN